MADLYRITAIWNGITGSPFYTVMHFLAATGTAQQAATAMEFFLDSTAGQRSSSLSVEIEPLVKVIDSATGVTTGSFTVTSTVSSGSSGTELLPRGTCLAVDWHTGSWAGGREIRGRTYLPGITETYNGSTGTPDSTAQGSANSAAAALIADATCDLVVYRREAHTWQGVTSGVASSQWSRLRTRRV